MASCCMARCVGAAPPRSRSTGKLTLLFDRCIRISCSRHRLLESVSCIEPVADEMQGSVLLGRVEPRPRDVLTRRPFSSLPDDPFHHNRTRVRIEIWCHGSNYAPKERSGTSKPLTVPRRTEWGSPDKPDSCTGVKRDQMPLFFVRNCT